MPEAESEPEPEADRPPPPRRSPYTGVVLLVAVLVPLTLAAHVVLLFTSVPTPQATCENAIKIVPSTWPSTHASAIDRCVGDLAKLESIVGEKGTMLTRLRAANLRRCLARASNVEDLAHCIEGLNDSWPGQLLHRP